MELKKNYKFWFATGSQDLYGDECLSHVAKHAQIIVQNFNESGILPFEVVWKPTLIDSTSIRRTFEEANADEECAGVITWMHTFSPANLRNHYYIFTHSLMKKSHMTRLIWIL